MKNISLGQYYPSNSYLHKADPRIKLIMTMFFIIASFLCKNILGFVGLLLFTFLLLLVSKLPFKMIMRSVRPIIIIITFTTLINVFWTKGENLLFSFSFISIYEEGLYNAFFMLVRIITLVIGASVLVTYTTTPIALTDAIESLFSPLKKIKVPVHDFAMMMTIALRFIPTLVEETEKIMNAQKSRGADFSTGGLIKRAKALIPILIPLFVSSFKRAEELATAMECRCYRGDKNRTKYVELKFKPIDVSWFFFGLVFFAALLLLRIFYSKLLFEGVIFDIMLYKI